MDEDVKEFRGKEENKISNFFSNIGIVHIVIVVVIVIILIKMGEGNTNPKYHYVIYFMLGAVILYLIYKPSKEKQEIIPRWLAEKKAQEELDRMVREGKCFTFDSKVYVVAAGRTNYENDLMTGTSGPVSWHIGFIELVHGSQYKKEGVISIHPYNGRVTGLEFRPLGYSGRESKDRDIIPVNVVQGSMKTTDFSGDVK